MHLGSAELRSAPMKFPQSPSGSIRHMRGNPSSSSPSYNAVCLLTSEGSTITAPLFEVDLQLEAELVVATMFLPTGKGTFWL